MQVNPKVPDDAEDPLGMLIKACERMEPMSLEELRGWQKRMGLSGRDAAHLLGMSATAFYDRANGRSYTTGGPTTISRVLTLACVALEVARIAKRSPEKKRGVKPMSPEQIKQSLLDYVAACNADPGYGHCVSSGALLRELEQEYVRCHPGRQAPRIERSHHTGLYELIERQSLAGECADLLGDRDG